MATTYSTGMTTLSPPLLAELLATSPQGIVAYEAVRGADRQILDYRTLYYTPSALLITGFSSAQLENQLLFQRSPGGHLFADQLRRVVELQEPADFHYFNEQTGRWVESQSRPLGDGFFTVFKDIDELKQTQAALEEKNLELQKTVERLAEQKALLHSVLNAAPSSITVERALRNEAGEIIDFQAILTNPASFAISSYKQEDVFTKTISELNPAFKPSGLFANYCEVLETGQPFKTESYYASIDKYLELTVTHMDKEHIIVLFNDVTTLRRNALELEQQNKLVDGVLRTSEHAVVVYEAVLNDQGTLENFRFLFLNEASLRYSLQYKGLTASDVAGKLVTDLYPESKQTGLWKYYVSVYETGNSVRANHYFPNFDKWYDVAINKLGNGLVVTLTDITLAQQAAQKLEEQANLFNGVLANITNGLNIVEAIRDEHGAMVDLRYVRVSQAVLDHTGLSWETLAGTTMLKLFPGVMKTAYWPAYQAVFATGEPQRFEVHYTSDGYDNYTDNWITQLDENRAICGYSVINDQKRAELQAKQQAALLQGVLNSCQMPIVLFEAIRDQTNQIVDFRYLLQNEANARVVGHPVAQTTTRTMLEVLPNLKTSGVFDRYVSVVESGQPIRFETRLEDNHVNGWFDISIVKQGDGIVLAANDQTLLRHTLQRAEQLVNDLKLSNQNLEQFAYVASHDLQEPLRKIQSFGDLVLNQYSDAIPDEGQDMLRRMQSAAKRMSLLIRDLLAYSRLSTQPEPFELVNLQALFALVINDLEMAIQDKKAQITIGNNMTNPLAVAGHPLQLRQLVQNLLSNALKFSRPHTEPRVHVQARVVSADALPASLHNRPYQSWIAIDVVDNGIGFDEQHHDRIFQLFERLHGRSEYSGTGIGLAICRKVAENHGGSITACSEVGKGSTFTAYLPVGK
ncbi:PAS domain-containing sensor histidine kinase [Spirosoma fluminis]